jgi:20S proteasome subunit beta 6
MCVSWLPTARTSCAHPNAGARLQVAFKTQERNKPAKGLTLEQTVDLVKDAMTSCGERDIYTGDYVDICIITKDGCKVEKFALKQD